MCTVDGELGQAGQARLSRHDGVNIFSLVFQDKFCYISNGSSFVERKKMPI
jgi:hypothetical protein